MNNTDDTITQIDDSNPLFIYIMLGVEICNVLISAWTSYKLGHFELHASHIKVCCCELDNLNIEVSDSEDTKEKKYDYGTRSLG